MNWRVPHLLVAASLSVSGLLAPSLGSTRAASADAVEQAEVPTPTEPPVAEAPTTQPEVTQTQVTEPPADEPPTTQPPSDEASTTQPTPPDSSNPDSGSAETTTPPTTQPETTASTWCLEASEVPTTSVGSPTTAEPAICIDGEDGSGIFGDGASNPGDPLTDEGPLETVPDVDATVPPTTESASAQPRLDYRPDEVLISSVAEARIKLGEAEARFLDAVAHVKSLRLRAKELDLELEDLDDETRETIRLVEEAEERMRLRATSAFTRGDGAGLSLDHDDLLEYRAQQTIVQTVFELDDEAIREYVELRDSLDVDALRQVDRRAVIDDLLDVALLRVEEEAAAVEQAGRELVVFEAGSLIYIENVTFPIAGNYGLPLIDSWGYPRMPGTPDAHPHQGIDIFAPMGTPLVAAERGVLTRVGIGRLGGLKLWLRGESGTDWYYAHLSAFAPGIAEGQVVEVGELVGYVGDTGNAKGTPPHLHLQVHPNGGDAINPYPMLRVISDAEIALSGG